MRWNVNQTNSISQTAKRKFYANFYNSINKEGEYLVTSSLHRDQARNIEDCYLKLKNCVLKAIVKDKKRIKTKPSRSSKEKRLSYKKEHANKKSHRRKFTSSDN